MGTKLTRPAATITIALALISTCPAFAEEPSTPGPMRRVANSLNPTNWSLPPFLKMPKFSGILPAKQDQTRIMKKKDGLMDDVSQTASRSWQATKAALSPKNLNPIRFFPASAKKPAAARPSNEPGFFGSLFAPPTPPQRPNTVTDFLGQAKPRG